MEELKKCKYCQADIPKKAKVCPNCKRTLKSHGCLISLVVVVAVIASIITVITIVIGSAAEGNKVLQKSVSGVNEDDEYITMEEYNAINTGMSYDEVKEIVGSDGEVTSQVESNGIQIIMITWYGNGMVGSNANVTFNNGEVTAKAQFGLK